MHLSRFPRVSLAHLPTPLELMPRLSDALGGPNIYIKRDDCTGLASGGNKTRKLEFSMGEAVSLGADTIVSVGAVQSNHLRHYLLSLPFSRPRFRSVIVVVSKSASQVQLVPVSEQCR